MLLIGVVYATYQHEINGNLEAVEIPSSNKIISKSVVPNNLGIVIKAKRILELIPEIKSFCQRSKK